MSHLVGVGDSLEDRSIDVIVVWVAVDEPVQEQGIEREPPIVR